MHIAAGTRLGRYEIRSLLGAGGMGEVYLAYDATLKREVALKLLPVGVSDQPQLMRRFVQEARTAFALNHPNIITIHEIGAEANTTFIVTEFINGVTLRERIKARDMPLDEVLDVALQVCAALTAAHEAGIVHRDIKPENIMLRKDGYVKVLDFGIAKLSERTLQEPDDDVTDSLLQRQAAQTLSDNSFKAEPANAEGQPSSEQTRNSARSSARPATCRRSRRAVCPSIRARLRTRRLRPPDGQRKRRARR